MHRVWRVADPAVHEALAAALADSELLIADGHHRYETARTYADEIGGEGPHRYTLMCLVSLDDPGLTVFATHRLLRDLDPTPSERARREGCGEHFDVEEVERTTSIPPAATATASSATWTPTTGAASACGSRTPRRSTRRSPDRSEAYRRLDAVILEALILKGTLGMTDDDIAAKRGHRLREGVDEALAPARAASADGAFLLRPTPVEQVREVAAPARRCRRSRPTSSPRS